MLFVDRVEYSEVFIHSVLPSIKTRYTRNEAKKAHIKKNKTRNKTQKNR